MSKAAQDCKPVGGLYDLYMQEYKNGLKFSVSIVREDKGERFSIGNGARVARVKADSKDEAGDKAKKILKNALESNISGFKLSEGGDENE